MHSYMLKKVPEHLRVRFLLLTPEDEKKIGDKTDEKFAADGKIYQDETEMKRVQSIVEKIVAQLPGKVPVRVFLYRDDYYNKENSEKPGVCEINIAKNRSGPTKTIELTWVSRYTKFSDMAL